MRGVRYLGLFALALHAIPAYAQTAPDPAENAAPVLAAPETEAVAPADASPPPAPADVVIAQPAETVEGLLAKRLAETRENADIAAFYATRSYAPLWVADGKLNSKALAAIETIKHADEIGLDAASFVLPDTAATDGSPDQLAAAEIALSRAVAAYARQAQGGRIEPTSLSPLITPEPTRPARGQVLKVMTEQDDVAAWLDTYNPPHAQFQALRKKLAEARAKANEPAPPPPPQIPAAKKSLKPGMSDDRVALLRERFALPRATVQVTAQDGTVSDADSRQYEGDVVAAVQDFQKRHGLNSDGVLGNQTLALLNDSAKVEDPIPLILVNMERWRWLPRDLGKTHIFVNVPEFMARIYRNGAVIHETRVITGSKQNQSPIFSDEMDHIIVNPSWNVPVSIASKEMLPKLQQDPYYLERQGFEVIDLTSRKKNVVDSASIDWFNVDMRKFHIRQPPGEENALGHIKFMFPNKHSVYLHDTPTRNLFAKDMRALSHGCIRVQDPFKLADVLLEDTGLNGAKLKGMVGGNEKRIDLAHKIPIHIAYFTAEVMPDGSLLTRPDVYGTDRRMKAALGMGGQLEAMADPVPVTGSTARRVAPAPVKPAIAPIANRQPRWSIFNRGERRSAR